MNCKYRILLPFWIALIMAADAAESAAKPRAKSGGIAVTSQVKRGGQKPQQLAVDVTGVETLGLTATGYSWGQAVWGNANLIDAKGAETRLVDLKCLSVRVGWGKFSRNKGPDNKPMSIGGVKIAHGLFAHADSKVVYRLSGKYVRFEAMVGINHTANNQGSVVFKVFDAKSLELAEAFGAAEKNFTKENITSLEKAIAKSIEAGSGNAAARKALGEIQSCAKSFDEIRKGITERSPEALKRTEALWKLVRDIRISELDAPLLFVKQHPYYAPHIYDDYLPYHPGGGIYVIENPTAPIDEHIVRAVIDPKTPETLGEGVYRDPDLSFDAKRLVFAFKGAGDNTSIYEIGVDGKGLRRLTNPGYDCKDRKPSQGLYGKGQHDVTPCYLPNGRIAFTSTRTGAHVMCFSNYIDVLHTMNADGSDIRCISVNNQTEFDPSVLPDGRIIYGRWEYIDKTALYMQSLWTVNPDGSNETAFFANNAESHGAHGVLELVDRFGFRTVVHREPDISCYAPMLVKPRPKPRDVISLIQPGKPATFVVHDIYKGMTGIERGRIRKLRVIETTARISGIPGGGRWWNQAFLASWQGSYDIKYFLGVVPVEEDGSAYFEAPPGKAIYFQALDADGRMVQSQRTFVQAVQGVARSCTGCHIKEDNAAPAVATMRPMAARKPPAKLKAESWGEGFLDYPTLVQPILDKRCVSCHGGAKGIAGGIDLTGGWTWAFNISYETLIKNTLVGFLNCNNSRVKATKILDPLTHGSGAAPLTKLLVGGHKKYIKDMPRKEIDLLLAWMDGNCNCYGTWDYSRHAVCNALGSTKAALLAQMKGAGCLKCHSSQLGNDWVNIKTPERSRILRAPLAEGPKSLGLAWCRDRKAAKPSLPFVTQRNQPPDVFRPQKTPAPNSKGKAVTTFADANNATYQAMLKIITGARAAALKAPRVDMPGAIIERGVCRQLPPLAPPIPPKRMPK